MVSTNGATDLPKEPLIYAFHMKRVATSLAFFPLVLLPNPTHQSINITTYDDEIMITFNNVRPDFGYKFITCKQIEQLEVVWWSLEQLK